MNMMLRTFALITCCLALVPAAASAQTPYQQGFEPVDRLREDIDPLQRSLRRVEQGLGQVGQESNVYRRPDSQRLYYIEPGVVAEFDRSEYFWFRTRRQGDVLVQAIPPGTVFHIGTPPAKTEPVPPPDHPLMVDARVHERLGGPARAQTPRDAAHTTWLDYRAVRATQHQTVLSSLDRALRQP